ncbi:hypothetical protein ACEQUB_p00345 (plasmid) [Ralstonia syzygii]|nr:hypothetical protein LMG10661_01022 [Ralstonia syzygii subsp. syzygii]
MEANRRKRAHRGAGDAPWQEPRYNALDKIAADLPEQPGDLRRWLLIGLLGSNRVHNITEISV